MLSLLNSPVEASETPAPNDNVNILPEHAIYNAKVPVYSSKIVGTTIGLAYAETFQLGSLIISHKDKPESFALVVIIITFIFCCGNVALHTIFMDYQISPYPISDPLLATLAMYVGLATCVMNILIYTTIGVSLQLFFKVPD